VSDPYQPMPQQRRTPNSDLDLNLMLTDPVAGRDDISKELKEKLTKRTYLVDSDGLPILDPTTNKPAVTVAALWNNLLYTRDMRLGNLSTEDTDYCEWWLQRAQDCMQNGLHKSALYAFSQAQTIVELSQSKKGFLRKQPNTLRTETTVGELEPAKKSLIGGKKSN
jgi:hypothetical protein